MRRRTPRLAVCVIGAALALAACGGDGAAADPQDLPGDVSGDSASDAEEDTATPVDTVTGPTDAAPDVEDGDGDDVADGTDDAEDDSGRPSTWRSGMYPEDWTPQTTDDKGRFLHDFSWAGYRNGEAPLGAGAPEATVDAVADHGADPTGQLDSTDALQSAIDAAAAAGGAVVHLPKGTYRVDGTLVITASRVVLRGEGASATRLQLNAVQGMSHKSHITFAGSLEVVAEAPLVTDALARTHVLEVADASGFSVGDDVAVGQVITDAFVEAHGMTGTWQAFNGTWQPFVYRTVTAVEPDAVPPRVVVDVPLRYPLLVEHQASVRRVEGLLSEVGVEGLGLADATGWAEAWAQDQVHALELNAVKDAWVRDVVSFPSAGAPAEGPGAGAHLQSGGIIIRHAKRVTVADSRMDQAQNRGGGGNGYLFEVRQSSEVLFVDCVATRGRHNFIQNWGFGATGIVWLRVTSREGQMLSSSAATAGQVGYSEFHHSLATANLIDSSTVDDGWAALNRGHFSSGAGHSATDNVLWNMAGTGRIRSFQYGWGYVIGTAPGLKVDTTLLAIGSAGTAPEDYTEGLGEAATLTPSSLYEDQLARRLGDGATQR